MVSTIMEAAIVAVTAFLGWQLSKIREERTAPAAEGGTVDKEDARPTVARSGPISEVMLRDIDADPMAYPPQQTTAKKSIDAFYANVASPTHTKSLQPKLSGVVSPYTNPNSTTPYFTSMRKQNTNPKIYQQKLDLFTGNNGIDTSATGVYRKKVETMGVTPPPQAVDSSGSAGNPYSFDRQLPVASLLQNNVSPIGPPQRVGPGLAISPDVPAVDGFHSMWRQKPPLTNAHKLNSGMPARVNPGVSMVQQPEAAPTLAMKAPPRFYSTFERRPPEKGRAAVTAPTDRADGYSSSITCGGNRGVREEYVGGAGMGGHATTGLVESTHTRSKTDGSHGLPLTNATGARNGVGAFVNTTYDESRFAAQQRESMPSNNGMLTGHAVNRTAADNTFLVQDTQRSLCNSFDIGPAGHMVPSVPTNDLPGPQLTMRETAHDVRLNLAPGIQQHMEQAGDKQLLRQAKRGVHQVAGYVYAPQRTSAFCKGSGGPERVPIGVVGVRSDTHEARPNGHASAGSRSLQMAAVGCSSSHQPRLPTANPRLDFGIAQQQLASNDVAVAPLHKYPVQ